MSTFSSSVGLLQPGINCLNNSGLFVPIPSTAQDDVLVCTGPNTYDFVSTVAPSSSGAVRQLVSMNPTTTNFVPQVGGGTTYTLASEFLVMNITPTSAASSFLIEFDATIYQKSTASGNIVTVAGFLNAGGSPLLDNQCNNGQLVDFTVPITATSTFSTGSTTPFTVNFCVQSTNPSTTEAISPSDAFSVIEINGSNPGTVNPSVISTSATPVDSFLLPSPAADTSVMYIGYQTFMDSANILSNFATFSLVVQQVGNPASVAPTIAANTILYDAVYSSPSVTFTPQVGGVQAQIVGVNGSTFICQNSFRTISP